MMRERRRMDTRGIGRSSERGRREDRRERGPRGTVSMLNRLAPFLGASRSLTRALSVRLADTENLGLSNTSQVFILRARSRSRCLCLRVFMYRQSRCIIAKHRPRFVQQDVSSVRAWDHGVKGRNAVAAATRAHFNNMIVGVVPAIRIGRAIFQRNL